MNLIALCAIPVISVLAIAEPDVSVSPTSIDRWSSDVNVTGVFLGVDEQGLAIRVGDEIIPQVIPWYDIKAVEPMPTGARAFQPASDLAWRAHQRLIRGDLAGAEKLYIQLESKYLWKNGPQSLDVALGLFLCRIDRGDRVSAIAPAVAWFAMDTQSSQDAASLGFDSGYRLFRQLPPVFAATDSQSLNIQDVDDQHIRAKIIAESYRIANDRASFHTPVAKENLKSVLRLAQSLHSNDPGVDLIIEMLICQTHPDIDRRDAARKKLSNKIRSTDSTWIEAWARLAIGNSLINEERPVLNEKGVIELIHIIVRMNEEHPNLAVLAATIAQEYLSNTDRDSWGRELLIKANTNR